MLPGVTDVSVNYATHRLQVRWDSESAATPFGQMAFFLEFLHLTGLYERWQQACPLTYTGPHGSRREDILGTWALALLAGHQPAHEHVTFRRAP